MGLQRIFEQGRISAAILHFSLSFLVMMAAALVVFGVWYPYPYRDISGGRNLFLILMAVDMGIGPLCTLIIFNARKSARELFFDIGVLGLMQIAALGYGLWSVYQARPVYLVFEYSLFRVVHANEIPDLWVEKIPRQFKLHAIQSPAVLSLRPFKNANEQFSATSRALEGISLSVQSELWQAYEPSRSSVLKAAKPISNIKSKFPEKLKEIDALIRATDRSERELTWVPLVSRDNAFWTVVLDATTAEIVGFWPLDSF